MQDVKLDSNFAYFLGVIAGDGYVGKNHIEVKTSDFKFLTDVYVPLVKKLFGINPRLMKESGGVNAYRVYFNSKAVFESLCKLNLKSPKTFTVCMPEIVKKKMHFAAAFVRGVFDTDGCIYTRKNKHTINYPCITLNSRSSKLIGDVTLILHKLNLRAHMTQSLDKGKPRYMVRLYGFEQTALFMSAVGFLNPYKAQKASRAIVEGPLRAGS